MKIQIDGAATINKGGELMLYSMLEQIEKHYPDAEVFWNAKANVKPACYIDTNLNFYRRKFLEKYGKIISTLKLQAILRRLKLPYSWLTPLYVSNKQISDLILDGRGYVFNDKLSSRAIDDFRVYYEKHKQNNTKIILMPQAFGPFDTINSKKIVKVLNDNVSIAIAREESSKRNLINAGFDPDRIWLYPDFTSLCKGKVPDRYKNLKGYVCIIPNVRMINDTNISEKDYVNYLLKIISYCDSKQKNVFLLNHESNKDFQLCKKINKAIDNKLTIVNGLKAKEVKGVISLAYFVISARYHGVANALNSGVPCLANSWSHKYELLFNDYGLNNLILDINSPFENTREKIDNLFDSDYYSLLQNKIHHSLLSMQSRNDEMWTNIWNFADREIS